VAGALPEAELFARTAALGFGDTRITERFACFEGSPVERHVARHLRVGGVNFYARKRT